METTLKRVVAIVDGRVQNVGYRYFVQMAAIGFRLNGRVCNQPDGTVKIVAEGSKDALEQFVSALWLGPRSARVDSVQETWSNGTGEYHEFAATHGF